MQERIVVAATGESLITRRLPEYRDGPFRRLGELIRSADVAFTHLETVLSGYRGTPVVESGGMNLSAEPAVAADLQRMGFNLAAIAGNHTLNYGIEGCLATLDALDELGFVCAGAGRHLAEARMPAYLETAAGRVALVAFASTFAPGQRAGAQRADVQGRPGLNPQRFDKLFVVDEEHLAAIRRIAERTGAGAQHARRIWMGFAQPPRREGEFVFAERSFVVGPKFGIRTEAHRGDLEGNVRSVAQARDISSCTLASMHAHEQGAERWEPADFIVEVAHACIDAGADMFVGHGPHVLRGLELYQGKPIFYSLGNFIFQHEYLQRFAADDYETLGASADLSPTELVRHLSRNETRSFVAERHCWETILPVCTLEDRQLTEIRLYPVTLGFGSTWPTRGTPRLADATLGEEILERMAALSSPFGTRIDIREGVGLVRL